MAMDDSSGLGPEKGTGFETMTRGPFDKPGRNRSQNHMAR